MSAPRPPPHLLYPCFRGGIAAGEGGGGDQSDRNPPEWTLGVGRGHSLLLQRHNIHNFDVTFSTTKHNSPAHTGSLWGRKIGMPRWAKVKETPRSFSPQPLMPSSGSDHSRSQAEPSRPPGGSASGGKKSSWPAAHPSIVPLLSAGDRWGAWVWVPGLEKFLGASCWDVPPLGRWGALGLKKVSAAERARKGPGHRSGRCPARPSAA